MSMNVTNVATPATVYSSKANQIEKTENVKYNNELESDVVELSNKNETTERTDEEKQKMIKSARKKGAGWSILGGPITALYYGLRSDKTVAKKFDLDPEKDKELVEQVKKEQTLWSIPGAICWPLGILAYVVANVLPESDIEV